MNYKHVKSLACRGPVDQQVDVQVDSVLMVGDVTALTWDEPESQLGYDTCDLKPAWYNGERAWLQRSVWSSNPPYTCDGLTEDTILSFEEGVKILIKEGVFSFPAPGDAPKQDEEK